MASFAYGLCHFAVLLESLRRFVALHRFPSSQRPCISSDGISTEWVLFPLLRRPLQQRDGRGLVLVAPLVENGRQPWTTCKRRCTSEQCSSRLRTAETSTHETRGQAWFSRTFAGCYATPRRSRPKPHQPDLFAPPYASMLYFRQPRVPHFTNTAPRPASASLGRYRLCTFFGRLATSSELFPRAGILKSRPWIISDQVSPFCRFAEGSIGPRANLRKDSGRSSRDVIGTTGAGPRGLLASAPRARAWDTPFCPFLAITGGSRWDFGRHCFFPVRAYRRFIWVSVQASIFLVLLHRSE